MEGVSSAWVAPGEASIGGTERMARFLNKLNSPGIAALVLVLFLVVDASLFYRYQATRTTPNAPAPVEAGSATTPGTTASEAAPSKATTVEETGKTTPSAPATSNTAVSGTPALGDLRGSIQECNGDQVECLQRLVEEAAPEAKYLGGRTDLNAYSLGRNREVFYFENPALEPCEYERQEYAANDGPVYVLFVVGSGSFDNEGGAGCIPQT